MPSSGKKQRDLADLLTPMENKILKLNTGCRILTETGVCLEPVSGCHVISVPHLTLLDSGRVYAWPRLPRVIGAIYLREHLNKRKPKKAGWSPSADSTMPGSYIIERFQPKPVGIKDDYVKVTFACNFHDSTIFRPIAEPGKLNPDNPETRFKLGFISMLGTTTFVNSLLKYMKEYLPLDPTINRNARKYPEVHKGLQDYRKGGLKLFQQLSENLSEQLGRWNQAHLENDWNKAQTAVISAYSPIRIAGAGFLSLEGKGSNSMVTILPQPDLDQCRIFTTVLLDESLNISDQADTASRVLKDAQDLKDKIENGEPEDWLGTMAQNFPFFYVSRTDWTKKLDDGQKQAIEIKAAQKFEF